MENKQKYAIGFFVDHYAAIPEPAYFGETAESIFDQMQADGLDRESLVNLEGFENDGIFWDKDKRG